MRRLDHTLGEHGEAELQSGGGAGREYPGDGAKHCKAVGIYSGDGNGSASGGGGGGGGSGSGSNNNNTLIQ